MKQGDIYWVNFEPSVGHEFKKIRPGLVLQNERISRRSPYVTVVPMTTSVGKWREPDIYVPKDTKNNLFEDSVIKIQQITSFDKRRFIKKIGEVNSPILRKARGYLRKHFLL